MAEVIIGNRIEAPETPRLVHTVMQASHKSVHTNEQMHAVRYTCGSSSKCSLSQNCKVCVHVKQSV